MSNVTVRCEIVISWVFAEIIFAYTHLFYDMMDADIDDLQRRVV